MSEHVVHTQLRKNALGVAGIVFLVLAAVAPLTGIVVVASLVIALGNGGGAPVSFFVVAIVLLFFAVGYAQMSKQLVNAGGFYAFVVMLIFFATTFIYLCRTSGIIRTPYHPALPGARPYSLSRFQMGFWFFLVINGYLFMYMITGELDTITDSVLALMGIGAGTALGAALIDAQPAGTATMTTETGNQNATSTVTAVVPMPAAPPQPSEGFMRDILSDSGDGISIHRFQMFAWTLILGVIFVGSVYRELGMPEFNATLLGLMGISSGTYIGFKLPEKKQSDQQAAAKAMQTP